MAKSAARYVCQSCGAVYGKWAGRCEACGAWNSIAEEAVPATPQGKALAGGRKLDFVPLSGEGAPGAAARHRHRRTGPGFRRRGWWPGRCCWWAATPGIGKSTLLLQAAAALAKGGARCVYVSGEEAVEQVRLRGAGGWSFRMRRWNWPRRRG